jgi:1,4-dihydroxy-2-naphthoyl-CoA hydrolase
MESIRAWVEDSSFGAGLGVRLVEVAADHVVVRLPFIDANSNPGGALHGGCAASLGVIGGLALAQSVLGPNMGPFHTAAVQVNYLAAAIAEDVRASTRLLRRGKELCFAETSVETDGGKAIAQVSCVVRGRAGGAPPTLSTAVGDAGGTDPGRMGPQVVAMPFSAGRGFKVDHMTQSYARIRMALGDANADVSGSFHEGALLALLDTTGAMAAWADTGPGTYKASTASIQAQIICAPTTSEVVAYGRVTQRDNELFWSSVEIADTASALVCARGTVIYRIVT